LAGNNVSTTNIWPHYAAPNVQKAAAKKNDGSLGKDDFLKILIEQLKNQDPTEPVKDRDFIAQMAQFSSVEQLATMSKEMALLRQNLGLASSMIGMTIEWMGTDSSGAAAAMIGKVDAIVVKEGKQYVISGSHQVPLDDVISISAAGEEAQPNE